MNVPKISIDELRKQFDADVERFSNEQTGQTTAVDAALVLSMIEESIVRIHPDAKRMGDIGCGAGNFSLRIARKLPNLRFTLLDLSRPMLDRACQRLKAEHFIVEATIQTDIAEAALPDNKFDIVVAGASLHHLRSRHDWRHVFAEIHRSLTPGGTFWIWDLIRHENDAIENVQKNRYAEYLISAHDDEFQKRVFENIDRSDSPETLSFLMRSLEEIGFRSIDILHKNTVFAALVARKTRRTSARSKRSTS